MLIRIICVARTSDKNIEALVLEYTKRLVNYTRVEWNVIELPRTWTSQPADKIKAEEWARIEKLLSPAAHVVLLDELGKEFTSPELAQRLQKIMNAGNKEIVFIIGGAYGFSDKARSKANETMALSKLTFTHQMVRVVLIEQLYRAHTIIKGEKYHH
ncbi:MAG: 23S rRNA (pseudouridine(1915)-N(3))-methyltransferase RlmH [Flavobacteriales bacterium]